MKTKTGRDDRRAQPHGERAGEAVLASGERTTLYRSLRELTCSRCAGLIREGELFTRESGVTGGMPLVRRCRACVPFKSVGGLLDALFNGEGDGDAARRTSASEVREKVLSRLGPALARRKARGDTDSES